MPDASKDFKSIFIKAGEDVQQDDHIRFDDVGVREADKRNIGQYNWVFTVSVIRNGKVISERRKFQINKGNFTATSEMYGVNTDNWEGKEMLVNIVKRQNPQTGRLVNGVALSAPGVKGEVEDYTE